MQTDACATVHPAGPSARANSNPARHSGALPSLAQWGHRLDRRIGGGVDPNMDIPAATDPRLHPLGDTAWIVEFGNVFEELAHARVMATRTRTRMQMEERARARAGDGPGGSAGVGHMSRGAP